MLDQELDFRARYRCSELPGIAVYPVEFYSEQEEVTEYDEEGDIDWYDYELVVDPLRVYVIMVGDDRRHLVDTDTLTKLTEDDYCPSCGQIGCGWH